MESILIKAKSASTVHIDSNEWISKKSMDDGADNIGIIYWGDEMGGVPPGGSLSYSLSGKSLAGIGSVYLQGATPIMSFHGYGLGPEMEEEYKQLTSRENNSVKQFVIAPMIMLDDRDIPVDVLKGMIRHAQNLRDSDVIDQSLADTVIRHLEASLDAAARNDRLATMQNIAAVTQTLSSIRNRSITPNKHDVTLVFANAYDFNIKYLHKRLFSRNNNNKID